MAAAVAMATRRKVAPKKKSSVQMSFVHRFAASDAASAVEKSVRAIARARANGKLTCVEICAGAGGQAIGLERAGFSHVALVEYESEYCHLRLSA